MENPLLPDEADKRGEQHFYRRSSSCRKSFITFFSLLILGMNKNASTCYIPPQTTFKVSLRGGLDIGICLRGKGTVV